jgi:hypothetical protein
MPAKTAVFSRRIWVKSLNKKAVRIADDINFFSVDIGLQWLFLYVNLTPVLN